MVIITCPECENKISDKAECCIHCGCPKVHFLGVQENKIDNKNTPNYKEIN
ncbi:MAG: hypothetical protein LBN07_03770 [Christensenellaceae bacterium]|jgi:hypothetical protein|nr:hypothetical protein [Christensenellaceae bacterium]